MGEAKGIIFIVIGALIILWAINYSLIWRTSTSYEDPEPNLDQQTLKVKNSQSKLIGFNPGNFIVPGIIGAIIIFSGIKCLKGKSSNNPKPSQKPLNTTTSY